MKTVFEKATRDELIRRIQSLREDSTAAWGKMNLHQMLGHCLIWNKWVLGFDNSIPYKQSFFGKLFGKMVLKSNTKNDKPMGRNAPAGSEFLVKDKTGDSENQKKLLIELVERYEHYTNPDFVHDFFGKMTEDEVGIFTYKHLDHHLRQFGA